MTHSALHHIHKSDYSLTAPYFFGLSPSSKQVGKHSTNCPSFGLQKNAMEYRVGVMPVASCAGGATTRCRVERTVSFDQRERRSPTFTTMVSGIGVARM